jgi:DNA-binding transcriptional MerR regulator
MLTVSQLARRCGLSRTALLYYESIGLMPAAQRSEGNYRCYREQNCQRLRQICIYRNAGLKLTDIRTILDRPGNDAASVLTRRLREIDAEIGTLRTHQQAILKLLQNKIFRRISVVTKEKWVAVMQASGFSEDQMHRWHREFERSAPAEHQEFLEFLHLPPEEIKHIREWSKKQEPA